MHKYTRKELTALITGKLRHNFGHDVEEATSLYMFKTYALILRDIMSERQTKTADRVAVEHLCQVRYLSLEFLMGRSLMKNTYNLGVAESLKQATEGPGFSAPDLFETEPDASLGNGGLDRLAACYLDSMTALEIPTTGCSIYYRLDIFKQKIVDGQQVELPDSWLGLGGAWLIPKTGKTEEVRFDGEVEDEWNALGRHRVKHTGYDVVLAMPKDMEIAGYGTKHENLLRLWDANNSTPADMNLFSSDQYLRAAEQRAMAKSIFKVSYPEDNHYESKSLHLKRQYSFVSAIIQSIVRKHRAEHGTLRNLHLKHVIQINDTHPTLAIPELMRILLDKEEYGWDEAWYIVIHTITYTNHTVPTEALERWPQQLTEKWLPRIWQILIKISNRCQRTLTNYFRGDLSKVAPMVIIWDGEMRMANLCACVCFKINGVSALHSDILKRDVFHDVYARTLDKFTSVTSDTNHRRWLNECNPELDALTRDYYGKDRYLLQPDALKELEQYRDDAGVLSRLGQIKVGDKKAFTAQVARESDVILNADTLLDVQMKRLREYKRWLLDVLHIIYLYQRMKADPHFDFTPRTYLFDTKAAPGYAVTKRAIHLINSVADMVAGDPACEDQLRVIFLENHQVSLTGKLMSAGELSEQVSTAGKEASGTGNMKSMMNGAVTIDTLDGANVEIHQVLGDENIFLFGLKAHEMAEMKQKGYKSYEYYIHNPELRTVIDQLNVDFGDGVAYGNIARRLLFGDGGSADKYLLLADFEGYRDAHQRADLACQDPKRWSQMALVNIARSGIFAASRSVRDYTRDIQDTPVHALK